MFTVVHGFGTPSLGALGGTSPLLLFFVLFVRASGLLGRRRGPGHLLAFGSLAQDRLPNCRKSSKVRQKMQESFNSQSGRAHFEAEMGHPRLDTSPT